MNARHLLLAATLLFPLAASAADPYLPSDAERARWTLSDMRSWQLALGAYRQDNDAWPAAKSPDDVRKAVEPKYILHLPMTDAWGRPYRFEPDGIGGWRLVSAGADGQFAPDTWSKSGRSENFADDAVLTSNDKFPSRSWTMK